MSRHHVLRAFALVIWVCVETPLVRAQPNEASRNALHVLVPAYGNPCCDGGPELWAALIAAARDDHRNFELVAILNPASGPGEQRDLNYLDRTGKAGVIPQFRSAGGKLYGYVSTRYGQRNDDEILRDVDGYLKDSQRYAGHVDGIFFDELSNDLANVARYRNWVQYVKQKQPDAVAMANPGVAETLNPSGQKRYSPDDYANVFDCLMTFEHSGLQYRERFTSTPSIDLAPALRRSHAIHSQAKWEPGWLTLAASRHADFLFVSDDVMRDAEDNPYDRIPKYWRSMLVDIRQYNMKVKER